MQPCLQRPSGLETGRTLQFQQLRLRSLKRVPQMLILVLLGCSLLAQRPLLLP